MMIGNVRSRTLVDDPANITPSYNAPHTHRLYRQSTTTTSTCPGPVYATVRCPVVNVNALFDALHQLSGTHYRRITHDFSSDSVAVFKIVALRLPKFFLLKKVTYYYLSLG